MKVGLDLTKPKIKKFNEFQVIQESSNFDADKKNNRECWS